MATCPHCLNEVSRWHTKATGQATTYQKAAGAKDGEAYMVTTYHCCECHNTFSESEKVTDFLKQVIFGDGNDDA